MIGERKEAKCPDEGRRSPKNLYLHLIIDFAGLAILTRADLICCSGG